MSAAAPLAFSASQTQLLPASATATSGQQPKHEPFYALLITVLACILGSKPDVELWVFLYRPSSAALSCVLRENQTRKSRRQCRCKEQTQPTEARHRDAHPTCAVLLLCPSCASLHSLHVDAEVRAQSQLSCRLCAERQQRKVGINFGNSCDTDAADAQSVSGAIDAQSVVYICLQLQQSSPYFLLHFFFGDASPYVLRVNQTPQG